jgi:hypothetical protein
MRRAIFLAALLFTALPAAAQTADTARIGAALAEACPGARVRLYRDAGGPAQGTCGPVVDARLVVREDGSEQPVALASVREVWVERRATGRGAAIGGGIGAGLLMVSGYVVVRGMSDGAAYGDDLAVVLPLAALVGGTTGGLIGGGIGYLTKVWERRYP